MEFYGVSDSLFSSGTPKPYSVSNYIATHTQGEIEAGKSQTWDNVGILVPAIPPSRLVGCNCINIAYVAKVRAKNNKKEYLCVCMCVCEREREREGKREGGRESLREREREREREYFMLSIYL